MQSCEAQDAERVFSHTPKTRSGNMFQAYSRSIVSIIYAWHDGHSGFSSSGYEWLESGKALIASVHERLTGMLSSASRTV